MESRVLEIAYLLQYSLVRPRVRRLFLSPYRIYQIGELKGTPGATDVRTADDSRRRLRLCPRLSTTGADEHIS